MISDKHTFVGWSSWFYRLVIFIFLNTVQSICLVHPALVIAAIVVSRRQMLTNILSSWLSFLKDSENFIGLHFMLNFIFDVNSEVWPMLQLLLISFFIHRTFSLISWDIYLDFDKSPLYLKLMANTPLIYNFVFYQIQYCWPCFICFRRIFNSTSFALVYCFCFVSSYVAINLSLSFYCTFSRNSLDSALGLSALSALYINLIAVHALHGSVCMWAVPDRSFRSV